MLYFECPSCKANCETTEAFAGKTVHCPHCGKQITVPIDPAAVSTTPLPPKPKPAPNATSVTTTPAQPAVTPSASPASASPAEGAGNPLRNLILIVVGIGIVVFLVIWLMQGDSGGGGGGGVVTSGDNPIVVMDTSMGPIKIELFQDKAPISTANFLAYADSKFYDGTIFHRVMSDFMIQGGGFKPGMKRSNRELPPIKNEASNGLSNKRGTLAMARTPDPNSATSEFFINVVDNGPKLDRGARDPHGYAVFAQVIDGMDVVDAIRSVPVVLNESGEKARPVQDVIIKSVRRVESETTKGKK